MGIPNQQYKINKKLLELLNIEDILYNNITLRKVLSTKLKVYLNEENTIMNIDKLVTLIKTSYSDSIDYPDCHYYHYNEQANYDNV